MAAQLTGMSPIRVMICEQGRLSRSAMGAGLEAAGFVVLPCDTPLAPESMRPDIAVIDLTLSPPPGLYLDGIALAERLARVHVPFVFVTEHGDDGLIQLAVQAGAIGYFIKPIELSLLGPSIRAWVAWGAAARRLREERDALRVAVKDGRHIGTAVGILTERHRLSPQAAFDALRRRARSERRALAQLAVEVVEGRVVRPDGTPEG